MFAVGGSGRGQAVERRVEITSTYGGGLKRDSGVIDIVLGIERDMNLLVGIDADRLKHGGPTSNASTFVYSAGFSALKSKTHDVMVNPSKLIADEHQIYMRPSFLLDYLSNAQSLHRLGAAADAKGAGLWGKRKISSDDSADRAKTTRMNFAQQVRLAMLKMEVGQTGERKTAERERQSLTDGNHADLAKRVDWISQSQPYVGYDISSFGLNRAPEVVEVKSSTGVVKQFHFSNNELRVAEKRRGAYRIVCVSNVFEKSSFHEIRDPAAEIRSGALKKVPDGYIVRLQPKAV
jgi:hypothetical protein